MASIITITGGSTSGKSTLMAMLSEVGMSSPVSTTTRAPRPGEVHGVDYHFVSVPEFARMQSAGELVEWNQHGGNFYGLSKAEFCRLAGGDADVAVIVDPNGAKALRQYGNAHGLSVRSVFLDAPVLASIARLVGRMITSRGAAFRQSLKRLVSVLTVERRWVSAIHYDSVVRSMVASDLKLAFREVRALCRSTQGRPDNVIWLHAYVGARCADSDYVDRAAQLAEFEEVGRRPGDPREGEG